MKKKPLDQDFTDIDHLMEDWEKSGLDFLSFFKIYEMDSKGVNLDKNKIESRANDHDTVKKKKARADELLTPTCNLLEGQLPLFPLDSIVTEETEQFGQPQELALFSNNSSVMNLAKTTRPKRKLSKGPIQLPLFEANLLKL